jgi:hypothetical protein
VQFSDDQQIQNSERGLQLAAAALDNINQNNDTYREFDVGVAGGDVFYNTTTIQINETTGSGGEINRTVGIDALEKRFDSADIALTYEGGGVFRSPSASARYQPKLRCGSGSRIGEDTVIVSLVNLTTDDTIRESDSYDNDAAVSPTGVLEEAPVGANSEVARFSATLVGQNRTLLRSGSFNVSLDVSATAYPEQWGNYLNNTGWDNPSPGTYDCSADTVLVRISTVELSQVDF